MSAGTTLLDQARHGSFCPKMCRFACPVAGATGREDATPWGLHTTVVRVLDGRADDDAAHALRGCSGCLACQVPCLYDLDVPAEVRAAREVAVRVGVAQPAVGEAVAAVQAGRSPYGGSSVVGVEVTAPDAVVVSGCRDDPASIAALVRLLSAAAMQVSVVAPRGCCGAVLEDLGAADAATVARADLAAGLPHGVQLVAADPHCRPVLEAIAGPEQVVDAASLLAVLAAEGPLRFRPASAGVTWHDPCMLARRDDVIEAPRALLAAAGVRVTEPEHSGIHTACSGGGMALDLLAPDDAAAVAGRRADELAATGLPVVTACAGAARRLAAAGADVRDLSVYLAALLEEPT